MEYVRPRRGHCTRILSFESNYERGLSAAGAARTVQNPAEYILQTAMLYLLSEPKEILETHQ